MGPQAMTATLSGMREVYLTDVQRRLPSTTTVLPSGAMLTSGFRAVEEVSVPVADWKFVVEDATRLPLWIVPTINLLDELRGLSRNWDSNGAEPIDQGCIVAAVDTLNFVMRDDAPPPSVVPTVHGGVQLEWHLRDIDLEVEIVSGSQISGYFKDHRTDSSWEADLSFNLNPLVTAIGELSRRR
jgi:hypothetical protein